MKRRRTILFMFNFCPLHRNHYNHFALLLFIIKTFIRIYSNSGIKVLLSKMNEPFSALRTVYHAMDTYEGIRHFDNIFELISSAMETIPASKALKFQDCWLLVNIIAHRLTFQKVYFPMEFSLLMGFSVVVVVVFFFGS